MNNFETRIENLEGMFANFMVVMEKNNTSVAESNKTALTIATDTQNQVVGLGRVINSVLAVQEEQMGKIQGLEDKFEIHMANEMINPAQEKMIKNATFKRVCEFLDPQDVEWNLYAKAYFGDMYSYVRKNHCMMNPIACTRSKNYDDVMEGIATWYPNISGIRDKADKRRKARKLAEKM